MHSDFFLLKQILAFNSKQPLSEVVAFHIIARQFGIFGN